MNSSTLCFLIHEFKPIHQFFIQRVEDKKSLFNPTLATSATSPMLVMLQMTHEKHFNV